MHALSRCGIVCTTCLTAAAAALAGQDRDTSAADGPTAAGCLAPERPVIDTIALIVYLSAPDTFADTTRSALAQLDAEVIAERSSPAP
jgi:hypothetical protein